MKERMKKFFNDKGFTLVELMVVVAILAVLTVVAIPLFSNSTLKSKQTACEANIRTIKSAMSMAQAELGIEYKDITKAILLGTNDKNVKFLESWPDCPFEEEKNDGDDYAIDPSNGNVTCEVTKTINHETGKAVG